jgi:adenylate cyclase
MTAKTAIRFALSLAVFALFFLHSAGIVRMGALTQVEAMTYDARTLLTMPRTPDPRVVIVDIDEKSIAVEGQWPWPRDRLAFLVTQLFDKYGIAVMGFDIAFAEPDRRSGLEVVQRLASSELADLPGFRERAAQLQGVLDNDRIFADAVRGHPVVAGIVFKSHVSGEEPAAIGSVCEPLMDPQTARGYALPFIEAAGYTGSVPTLQAATPLCGFFDNPRVDDDGVYRRVPLLQMHEGAVYPSLALALVRAALGNPPVTLEFDPPEVRAPENLERLRVGPLTIPVDGEVSAYVPYRGPYHTTTYVSAADVLWESADPKLLHDAIVIVGTSAPGLLDFRLTPAGRFAGVEVHANLISGMLDHTVRQKPVYYLGIEVLMLLAIALVMAGLFPRLSPLFGAGLALAIIGGIAGFGFLMWTRASFITPVGVPVVFTLAVFMTHLLYGYFIESRGKRQISRLFGQYVPPELVEEMATHPESVSMEGENREMSVLFSDVRGFTTISEKLDARELSTLMNVFLTQQTGVIQRHRGTIDKYMGDAIMAFWGAPLPDGAHALHALESGMEMCRKLRELDAEFQERGWPLLNIGVGINSGRMNVGNMGSEFRVAYTVMGDAVNLGSRVEGLTKEYGVSILCTEFARVQAPENWVFREMDRVRVKGKNEPVAIYEPFGPVEHLPPVVLQDLARHRIAIERYRAQEWDAAQREFLALRNCGRPHKVYELFLERIEFLRDNPPGVDWDGAFTFTHK